MTREVFESVGVDDTVLDGEEVQGRASFYFPRSFTRTDLGLKANGDPRLSLEDDIEASTTTCNEIRRSATDMIRRRHLLAEDLDVILERTKKRWSFATREEVPRSADRRSRPTKRLDYSPKHTMLEPTARAMNCCPPDAKVIGEVLMVAFSGTRHNVF